MSSLQLARIPLGRIDGVESWAIAEWDKNDGYVICIQIPIGTEGLCRVEDRSCHPNVSEALRNLAELIENRRAGQ
jgi:hypothetical protein